ncbi:MAG TPA: SDR family NAD(P)-dependent oxidoreductase, partial [Chitinophagaceae bacterium]|nr:SDR family NAD(P)-dependent oxidoreductase [Chitinophagaceae bacterium]
MNLSLEDRTAVICGSTQGIGLAIAEELALLGASCILIARNEDALKESLTKLSVDSRQLHSYAVADFTDAENVRKVISEIMKKNVVHILINNTGGPPAGPICDAKEEEFIKAFNQHLICNHILTKAVVPGMIEANFGRIINIIST